MSSSGRKADPILMRTTSSRWASHDQTDAPFANGRLVVTTLGRGVFTFDSHQCSVEVGGEAGDRGNSRRAEIDASHDVADRYPREPFESCPWHAVRS